MKEKYLPIGTVVLLKGGKKEVMIIGYAAISNGEKIGTNKDGKDLVSIKMHDYCAVPYPEGLLASDRILGINHKDIEKVVFNGYETDQQKEISNKLNVEVDKFMSELNKKIEEEKQ